MNLVNVVVFGVPNRVIVFFREKCYRIDYTRKPNQKKVLAKVNFLYHCHYWYLRERFFMEELKSLFASVP